jgi:hypothetical protein
MAQMKLDPALIQSVVTFLGILAAFMAAMYGVITRPLLKRMDDIRADLLAFRTETNANFKEIRTELKSHGERLTRVEERLPPPLIRR